VATLFAAFLGFNPIQTLLGPQVLGSLPSADRAVLTGKQFFPQLISGPFHQGLVIVFTLAIVMTLVSAAASLMRGRKYVHDDGADASVTPAGSVPGGRVPDSIGAT
jgi:hypothetical protein